MYDQLNNSEENKTLIFHYTKTSVLLEDILPKKKIRFNSLVNMNDPLEFELFKPLVISDTDLSTQLTFEYLDKGKRLVDIIKKVCKVCCFSKDIQPNITSTLELINRGYCLPRMWSQYGENHYGVCLVFDKDKLYQSIIHSKEILSREDFKKFQFYENDVVYDNLIPGLQEALVLKYEEVKDKATIDIFKKNITPFLFSKFENYRDEQEYRIVIYNEKFILQNTIDVDFDDSLRAVILGCRFKDVYLPSLKSSTENRGIEIFQLRWYNGHPQLERR